MLWRTVDECEQITQSRGGTNLLACGWLVGGVRVLLFAFEAPTGLPSGPFCLLFVGTDMSRRSGGIQIT